MIFVKKKLGYYIDSHVFLADSVDLADISDFFADILTFFHDGGKIEKSHGGTPPGPRGSAPASVRRRALRCAPV